MDLIEFKKRCVCDDLGIDTKFGKICSFIDFGNVNYWFEEDRQDSEHNLLPNDKVLTIDIKKLKEFSDSFSKDTRFYYGHDIQNQSSLGFIKAAREIFGKHRVFTKQIQKIKHYLSNAELDLTTRNICSDNKGRFVTIPKCNFDVEITVDAIRLADSSEAYDTICLFSGDADFVHLVRFLKDKKQKNIILIKGGHIIHQLKKISNKVINAQDIKKYIAKIKQKPGF